MDDKCLNNLKTLWEELEDPKSDNKNNENEIQNYSVNDISRYQKNSKWIPPNFAKLPTQHYGSKSSSQLFSMAYNEEERRNLSSPSVLKFYLCFTSIKYFKIFKYVFYYLIILNC